MLLGRKASHFYIRLAQRLVERGIILDLLAASLDQVGAAEQRLAVEASGGLIVLAESFEAHQFRRSLQALFECDAQVGFA